jgi:hypothetical protein
VQGCSLTIDPYPRLWVESTDEQVGPLLHGFKINFREALANVNRNRNAFQGFKARNR